MNLMQYAIARAARQVANRVNGSGHPLSVAAQGNAVATFEALAQILAALTPGEYAAVLPTMQPIFDAAKTVERWRMAYLESR